MTKSNLIQSVILIFLIALIIFIACDDNKITGEGQTFQQDKTYLRRGVWTYSSKPQQLSSEIQRAKLLWYNPYNKVKADEIWDIETLPGANLAMVLNLDYNSDIQDKRAGLVDTLVDYENAPGYWGGITTAFDLLTSHILFDNDYLYIRLKGDRGIMHFELGRISEDINGDGEFTTEDISGGDNFIYDDGEDVGLDGLNDNAERIYYGLVDATSDPNYSDPSGDNWDYDIETSPEVYSNINGFENNYSDPEQDGKPDGDDINGSKTLDMANRYYSYDVDLADPYHIHFISESINENGWKSYAIPLKAPEDTIGFVLEDQMNYFRIWVESPYANEFSISIAEMKFMKSEDLNNMDF